MQPFDYHRATTEDEAVTVAAAPDTVFLAGGTTVVDLLRLGVMRPSHLVDIRTLPMHAVTLTDNTLHLGALSRNSDVAHDPRVKEHFPVLAEALLSGASAQLRNMATTGGNLLQRTRCAYYRDPDERACNKRMPGSGCAAQAGWTRMHAILGTSEHCLATHPSDMCVGLLALDAVVHIRGAKGEREVPIGSFHVLPGDRPEVESVLEPGELVVAVTVPVTTMARRSKYLKVRDRSSYAFALASCGAAIELDAGVVRDVRVALGGVGTRPWRAVEAEAVLRGQVLTADLIALAAEASLRDVKTTRDNTFKVDLAKAVMVRVLTALGGLA